MCKQAFAGVTADRKENNESADSDSDEEGAPINSIQSLELMHEANAPSVLTTKMALDSGLSFNLTFCQLIVRFT
jgi:hypothetical protein